MDNKLPLRVATLQRQPREASLVDLKAWRFMCTNHPLLLSHTHLKPLYDLQPPTPRVATKGVLKRANRWISLVDEQEPPGKPGIGTHLFFYQPKRTPVVATVLIAESLRASHHRHCPLQILPPPASPRPHSEGSSKT